MIRAAAGLLIFAAATLPAEPVRHDAGAGLEPVFRNLAAAATTKQWIAYAVDSHARHGRTQIFFRAEGGEVRNIRIVSDDCRNNWDDVEPDHWLTNVRLADSVRLLDGFVRGGERRLRDGAIAGIAMHDDPSADTALESYVAADQAEDSRRSTAFWLGVERGHRGYEVLARMLRDDPSDRVREHVIFALSRSSEPEALPLILRTIRSDRSVQVRKRAMFWLAQSNDPRAIGFIDQLLGIRN